MSQKARILQFLQSGRVLTRFNAWEELGVFEAPSRICELRKDGHTIETSMRRIVNRFGERVRVAEWYLPIARPNSRSPRRAA